MTISDLGRQYICENFGDTSFCCINAGLSWYSTRQGVDYPETGGTAQIVSRLALGLMDSLTMTSPARGTFTQAELNAANGSSVTLTDAQEITFHDEPSEDQWCFIPCEEHGSQAVCLQNECYWYNNSCHTELPTCESLLDSGECVQYGCYWYNGSCHSASPSCETLNNQPDCEGYGCYWYNGSCHTNAPICENLNNQFDCELYTCFWYRGQCHSIDQPELCYWIDSKGGHTNLAITDIFEIVDAFLFATPPSGWSFVPTITQIFGILDYFLGFNGDTATGCNYLGG